MTLMALDDILDRYEDGDEQGWGIEFYYLLTEHADKMRDLIDSVGRKGIEQPVLLGSDGRVWDGHHRLCAAAVLDVASVPVQFA